MMPDVAVQTSAGLLRHLADSAARALLFGAFAGLGLFVFRVKATSARLFTWTVVLYAGLAMPMLAWMLPPLTIPTPTFPQFDAFKRSPLPETSQTAEVQSRRDSESRARTPGSAVHRLEVSQPSAPKRHSLLEVAATQLSVPATAIYFAVTFILFARLVVGSIFTRRLLRSSQRIHDTRVTRRLAAGAHSCGLKLVPHVAESEAISVPVTIGALHSSILLPSSWREWEDAKLDSAIAHEVSHVARRDALTQRLSLLHRAVFWFSPLAWWLNRHLAELAEQASDEFALDSGVDRSDYARTLLGFFEALQGTPARVRWEGVAMATMGPAERQAEQRLERILEWKQAGGAIHMRSRKLVLTLVVALAIPAVYLVASAQTSASAGSTFEQPLAPISAPSAVSGPHVPVVGFHSQAGPAPTEATAPAGQTASEGLTAVSPVQSSSAASSPGRSYSHSYGSSSASYSANHGYSYAFGDDDDMRFVIVTGNSDSLTMSGSTEDARHVERLRKQIPGDFIWFQEDEKSYLIRDQATIDRARQFWAPQEELGKKQEALGKQQEALGKQQEALGHKMEQVQVKVPDMTAELDKLKAELKQLSSGATVEQVGQLQSEIGELQSKIGDIQSHAGDQQSKVGDEMSALGDQQSKLGDEQSKLGDQQAKLAEEASRKMKLLLDEALKNGVAKPESGSAPTL